MKQKARNNAINAFINKGCLLACLLTMTKPTAVSQEAGMPVIRNYTVEEFRSAQQNWAVAQDKSGIMYFGNGDGLLEYDGVNWRLHRVPIIRSIAIDSSGTIYAGLENDLGYFVPDATGNLQFHSLRPLVPEGSNQLVPFFKTFVENNTVYFQNDDKILIYRDGGLKMLTTDKSFHVSFIVNGRFYVRERGTGLLILEQDRLKLVPGSDLFAEERIYGMLPYDKDKIMIITRSNGIWIYSPGERVPFHKPDVFGAVDQFFMQNWPYCGTVLPGGDFAVGTITAGILVFDRNGRIKSLYDRKYGMQDNTIYSLLVDKDRQLWATLDNGISRVEINLPFRIYSTQEGLSGSTMCIRIHNNELYVGTSQYLFKQNKRGFFDIIEGTAGQNFELYDDGDNLLLARNPGVCLVKGGRAYPVEGTLDIPATTFARLRSYPDYLFHGGDALYLFQKKGPEWKLVGKLSGFNQSVYGIAEDLGGNVWLTTGVELYRVEFNQSLDSVVRAIPYAQEKGLPSSVVWPFPMKSGDVLFGTISGIYRYLDQEDRFEPHPDFTMLKAKVTLFLEQDNGDIWIDESPRPGTSEKGVLHYRDGKYELFKTPFYKFASQGSSETPQSIFVADDGTVYLGMPKAILQYNPMIPSESGQPFRTLIRRVISGDSVLYGGSQKGIDPENLAGPKISWKNNDLTFAFSASFYEDSEQNLYSYRLGGSDTAWSDWVPDHKKEYTNIPEGRYRFEVRSINEYKTVGSTAAYSFTILAPWYRTWWAYLGYAAVAGLLVYLLITWRTRQLQARSRELERIVKERTAEIQEQKDNVEQLSRIGRDITASLSIGNIIKTVYENVNKVMDASVFSIGLHKPEEASLEFPAGIEKGQPLPAFTLPLNDDNRLGIWCFNHRQEVVINDYEKDFNKYVLTKTAAIVGEKPESILYLPLWSKDKVIGVITAQSFRKNAYSDYQVNILRNLATYSAIALENADAYRRLAALLEELKSTQDKLVTQSKLAALGALTAGIAHEIKNPLNFVNNFAAMNKEMVEELRDMIVEEKSALDPDKVVEIEEILHMIGQNAGKIQEHGRRADSIVRSMLQHSRGGAGERQITDINAMLEEDINLAYHGMRAQDSSFNIKIETDLDRSLPLVEVVPQDISRVFLNVISNGFYEAHRRKLDTGSSFSPLISIRTRKSGTMAEIRIRDNGYGIPAEVGEKLFTPFFTTKPAGKGTGLGLSISYDIIVHNHKGTISFETEEGNYAEFIILLPLKQG